MSAIPRQVLLSQNVIQTMIRHLEDTTTDLAPNDIHIPADQFVNPRRAQAEIALMKRLPLLVAHRSELPHPGDFVTRTVLGMPLVISRQKDHSVRVFLNMCRHRGGQVESQPSGNRRVMTCRYHGWSYDSEGGSLRTVPYESSFDAIDRSSHGLVAYKTEEAHGLIFVDFSNDPDRTLRGYLGPDVEAQVAPWQLENSVIVLEKQFSLDVNWKLLVDGAIDVLHPQFLHPGGVANLIETNVGIDVSYGRHAQHFGARTKLRTLIKEGRAHELGTKYIASNLMLYPNAMMIMAPEHIEFWTVWPSEDPNQASVTIRFFVRQEILNEEVVARIHKSWAILENAAVNEDWPMATSIQQNCRARPDALLRYGRSEIAAQHLHRQLARDIDGIEL